MRRIKEITLGETTVFDKYGPTIVVVIRKKKGQNKKKGSISSISNEQMGYGSLMIGYSIKK